MCHPRAAQSSPPLAPLGKFATPTSAQAVREMQLRLPSSPQEREKFHGLDDINLEDEYWHQGDPIRFTNPEIRRMLTLAKAGKDDVFCDFGSGFAKRNPGIE